jgi:hypothetical protein
VKQFGEDVTLGREAAVIGQSSSDPDFPRGLAEKDVVVAAWHT